MEEMNASHRAKWTALDREPSARRVQTPPRRSSGLERCWTALQVAPAGTRSVKPPGALVNATHLTTSRFNGPVRFR